MYDVCGFIQDQLMTLRKVCHVCHACIVFCLLIKVEEGKVVRVQLELAQVKADIDRRIHEKEEEFEITRYLLYHKDLLYLL